MRNILMKILFALSLTACTAEQAYYSLQGWQRNQCDKIPEKAEFDRCLKQVNTTYESYQQQIEPQSKSK